MNMSIEEMERQSNRAPVSREDVAFSVGAVRELVDMGGSDEQVEELQDTHLAWREARAELGAALLGDVNKHFQQRVALGDNRRRGEIIREVTAQMTGVWEPSAEQITEALRRGAAAVESGDAQAERLAVMALQFIRPNLSEEEAYGVLHSMSLGRDAAGAFQKLEDSGLGDMYELDNSLAIQQIAEARKPRVFESPRPKE